MGPKTVVRMLIMIACSAGVAYGASQIGQLPAGPREVVARIGKWLQKQADSANPMGPPPALAPPHVPAVVETGQLKHDSVTASEDVTVPVLSVAPAKPSSGNDTRNADLSCVDRSDSDLEMMASGLRELGATHYSLQRWGAEDQLFRFTCEVAVGGEAGLHQHFEAIADSSTQAMSQVIDHVVESRSLPPQFDQ